MHQTATQRTVDLDPRETAEWMEALDQIVDAAGPDRVTFLLDKLTERARDNGVQVPIRSTTFSFTQPKTSPICDFPAG